MQFGIRLVLAAVIALATVSTCRADFLPVLSLSSPDNLNNLTIGQTVTINVTSVLQTSAGRMVFGRLGEAPASPDRSRRRQGPPSQAAT